MARMDKALISIAALFLAAVVISSQVTQPDLYLSLVNGAKI